MSDNAETGPPPEPSSSPELQPQHSSSHRTHGHRTGHRHRVGPPPRLRRWPWLVLAFSGWLVAGIFGLLLWWAWNSNADYYDTTGGVYERYHSGARKAKKRIAIIDVGGVIVDGYSVQDQIKRIRNDKRIVAVVLRVESPGGTVTGSDYIYHYLKQLRKETDLPLVVSMGSMAASGGYYIAMSAGDQEDVIFAEPTTITGSIGVVLPHYDFSRLLSRFDVEDDSIRSHPNKQILSMTRAMTPEQREIIQREVDASFERFKRVVLDGRPALRRKAAADADGNVTKEDASEGAEVKLISLADNQDLATGQVFSASEAMRHGLVDRIGFLEDAIDRAAELAGVSLGNTRVIRLAKPKPLIELPALLREDGDWNAFALLTRPTTPQCWYLAGSAPPFPPARYEFEQ